MCRPFALACGRRSSTTCEASSRVGTRTSAPGRLPPDAVRSTTGSPKARVLPDPVGDAARMSTPARASSSTRLCTANGVVMLRSASVRTTGVLTPRALKDFDKLFDSLVQGSRCKKLESPEKEEREAESHGRNCAIRDFKVAASVNHGGLGVAFYLQKDCSEHDRASNEGRRGRLLGQERPHPERPEHDLEQRDQ